MLSEINEFLGRITTEGIVISGEKVKKRKERKRRVFFWEIGKRAGETRISLEVPV